MQNSAKCRPHVYSRSFAFIRGHRSFSRTLTKYTNSLVTTEVVPGAPISIAPIPVAVEQLYAELERKVRELRPKDDVSGLAKAHRLGDP